uniref:Si:ch73-379j16.2 n=1 Tax=Maylandia zebra TaxID=106582 RepID=A0A3P9ATM9_9CICH
MITWPYPLVFAALFCCVQVILAQIKYLTPEDVKVGAIIGNVAKDLGLDVGTLISRRFRIVSGAQGTLFEVNPNNGALYVHENVDREQLCDRNVACLLDLKIVVENPLEVHYVTVEIIDTNDNRPSFTEKEKVIEIAETTLPGARFQLPGARDRDVGVNAVQIYKLSQNDHFHLEIRDRGEDKIPFLVLQRNLDRERKTNHSLILTAMDGGTPPKSANLSLTIKVLDNNDNRPVFSQEVYSVTLQENAPLDKTIIKVQATDLDEGINGDVEYTFGGDITSSVFGALYVSNHIDREELCQGSGACRMEVKILVENPLEIHYTIVEITDINDNSPSFPAREQTFEIAEQTLPGKRFQLHTARDPDAGLNSIRTYTITSNEHFEVNIRQSDAGKVPFLVLKKSLDREQNNEHKLVMTAVDGGKPPRSGTLNVTITVLDSNDNRPIFSQEIYHLSIKENIPVGASVFRMNATDYDDGTNGEVEYTLGKTLWQKVYDIFELDKISGEITFQVVASDSGTPSLTFSLSVFGLLYNISYNGSK